MLILKYIENCTLKKKNNKKILEKQHKNHLKHSKCIKKEIHPRQTTTPVQNERRPLLYRRTHQSQPASNRARPPRIRDASSCNSHRWRWWRSRLNRLWWFDLLCFSGAASNAGSACVSVPPTSFSRRGFPTAWRRCGPRY